MHLVHKNEVMLLILLVVRCRFPPYTPAKTFLIKCFSLHALNDAVNVPIPVFRFLGKAAFVCGVAMALGVNVSFSETPFTEYVKSLMN